MSVGSTESVVVAVGAVTTMVFMVATGALVDVDGGGVLASAGTAGVTVVFVVCPKLGAEQAAIIPKVQAANR